MTAHFFFAFITLFHLSLNYFSTGVSDFSPDYIYQGRGLQFIMKCYILHVDRTSTLFKQKLSYHFKDLHKFNLLTNIDVNLTASPGEITNTAVNLKFAASPGYEVRLISKFVKSLIL